MGLNPPVKDGDDFILILHSTGTTKPLREPIRSAFTQITPQYFLFIHFYSSSEATESASLKPAQEKGLGL